RGEPYRGGLSLHFAKWNDGTGGDEKLAEGYPAEGFFARCVDVVEFLVEWTEPRVRRETKRAMADAFEGGNRVDHVEDGDLLGCAGQRVASTRAGLRSY